MSDPDFKVVAGTDFQINYTALDSAGAALNLTGYTINWYLKKEYGEAALISKSTSSGITVTNAAAGTFTVTVLDTNTTNLIGRYFHEVILTDGAGLISALTDSDVEVSRIEFRRKYGVA